MRIKQIVFLTSLFAIFLCVEQNSVSFSNKESKLEKSKRAAFRLLLTEEMRKTYDALTDSSALAEWENRFWKALDPTPTTPENERYEEHLRRFNFAQKYYSNIIPPLYLDDRGKYYIKYGEPDDFVASVGIGKEYLSNVTWVYYHLNLFIDFVDRDFYGYEEVNDLGEAVSGQPHNVKAYIASQLYAEREGLHSRYGRFRGIESAGDIQGTNDFYSESSQLVQEKELALSLAPPHEYHHDYQAEPLSASLQCANFRDDDQKTRIEFYYSVPLREITFVPGQTYPLESHLEKQISISDRDLKEVLNKAERLLLGAVNQSQVEDKAYVNQHEEIITPGPYNIALRLENPQGKRLAILKAQFQARDFSGNKLMLSDLELASDVREGASGRCVKKNNIQVIPYIPRIIKKQSPLYVYFEIYNLKKNDAGMTQYTVNYTLRSQKESESIFTKSITKIAPFLVGGEKTHSVETSFDGYGTSEFQQIYLLIDFSRSPSGESELAIRVTDRLSYQQADTKVSFKLE